MAHVLNDRVKETSTSTGTGTINLAGAVGNFETFVAGIGDGNTTYYAIVHRTANEFEIGLGTITDASTDTLTGRSNANVISSSNSDNVVDFSAGTKDVFCTLPASKAITLDNSGNIPLGTVTLDSSGNITLDADGGTITFADAGSSLGTITSSGYSGKAATATALATARDIGGVSFDGTGNIDLPGVNTAGNQNTSGTAAVATVATTVTITDNESTNENNAIVFTSGGDVDGGNLGLESDGDLTYNPSTGTVTATVFSGSLTGNASTATNATNASHVLVTDNESTNEENLITFVEDATSSTGNVGLEMDGNLTYNPSTGTVTATAFSGSLTGNASTATALATARNIGGVSFDGTSNIDLPGVNTAGNQNTSGTATNATNASHVLVTDNESTNEENLITFVEDATSSTGNVGLEMDGNLTYNPSTGTVTATAFSGSLTGNASTATNATNSSHVLVTDNESTNEENLITFVEDATSTTGNVGLEMDGNLTYNPSTGTVTATAFSGSLTGNASTATALATARDIGGVSFDGTGNIDLPGVNTAGNQNTSGTAAVATTVTITDNESTNENNAIVFTSGGDVDGGNLGLESDGDLTYNPSTGTVTATAFSGSLTGNASTATALATARNIGGVSFDGTGNIDLPGVNTAGNQNTSGTAAVATVATTVTITDNESTNEDNAIVFTSGGDVDGGNLGLESDGNLTYNPSTGKLTATQLAGELQTAAQTNITSVGTLSSLTTNALTVDDVGIDGKVITMTGSTDDTATFTVGTNGTLSITTTDTAASAANISITADGTAELAGTTVTLNSSGGVTVDAGGGTITFADDGSSLGTITSSGYSGNAGTATALATARNIGGVSFDGTGNIDLPGVNTAGNQDTSGTATNATNAAHVLVTDNESTNENNLITFVEDATSSTGNVGLEMDGNLTYNPSTGTVTATGFSGNLTGTLQTAAQTNVTSLGTLTALTVDNININGNTVISTDTNGDINLTPNGTGKVNITSTSNTNTLQLTSADASSGSAPDMVFLRNSSSPADNDFLGRIDFQGTNSVAGTHVYGGIFSRAIDVTDGTEDGQIHLSTSSGGTLDTTGDLIVKSGLVTAPKTGFYRNLVTTATASFGDTILSTGQVFTDSYDVYEVYFKQVVLDTDDVSGMWIRLLDSSGNQISTESYGYYNLWLGNSASDNNQIDNRSLNTSAWKLSGNDEFSTGNASGEGFSGFFRLHNTRETSYEVIGGIQDASYKSVDGYAVRSYGSVWRNSTTAAISGCQLMVFSGVTISSASLAVYGYKLGV